MGVYCESHGRKSSILTKFNVTLLLTVLGFGVAAEEIREIWVIWARGVGENRDSTGINPDDTLTIFPKGASVIPLVSCDFFPRNLPGFTQ